MTEMKEYRIRVADFAPDPLAAVSIDEQYRNWAKSELSREGFVFRFTLEGGAELAGEWEAEANPDRTYTYRQWL